MLQTLIEILGFISFRMNPDLDPDAGFDPDVEIANVYNCTNESSARLAVSSTKKSLKEKFAQKNY